MADNVEFVDDAVGAMYVARHACDLQGLAGGVALEHGDCLGRHAPLVHQPAEPETALESKGDLGLHVGEFFLNQLVGRERPAELGALERIGAGRVPAELGGAQCAPGDAVARPVEAAERPLESLDVGQQIVLGHEHIVHDDLAGDRGPERELAFDLGRGEPLHAFLQEETADLTVVVFRPHHEDVGDRRVGDPHLGAGQLIAAVGLARAGFHAARVGAMVGLGEADADDPFAFRQLGQVLLPLLLGAVGVDGVHAQARLDAQTRAIGRIHALELAGDEAVGHVVDSGAAVALERRAQESQRPHLGHDLTVEALVAMGLQDARHQLVLGVGPRAVANHALLLAELVLEDQGVIPLESGRCRFLGRLFGRGGLSLRHLSFRSQCPGASALQYTFLQAPFPTIPFPTIYVHRTAWSAAAAGAPPGHAREDAKARLKSQCGFARRPGANQAGVIRPCPMPCAGQGRGIAVPYDCPGRGPDV